ncbi:hypothetical protein AGABI1DRAFT_126893 [Agaricus bisporus var. burnettii JB137-S8]|uniref:Uncharacterized protein n=1 Tax=Agaricus bisporus var. burnettii (strain JB137-S8 / ATCC MYA-4627 / FGSC 10392) TaxID=597362 RepID=K5XZI2_AGABU|nr:uncharacterized protein AGABI1DRAFT_126893 [Agaricus bisporus var. burnettii JB137-S8]EKM80850.1 hypothetical protein AGABI1DRAFT_126893 [Agaricus bisporus var. burnettii JB137-S8]
MSARRAPLHEDTSITLEDGEQVRTRYDSEQKKHIVTCNMCNTEIKLAGTAHPYPLERHRSACKRQQKKRENRKFRPPEGVFDSLESFDFQLLFQPALASPDPANSTGNRNQVECPGQWVQWSPGSVWETYPFQLHKANEVGWTPISIDGVVNGLVVRAKRCWKQLDGIDVEDEPRPCHDCKEVPHTVEFKDVVRRAQNVKEHTPWMYLTDQQKEKLMRQMAGTIRRLRSQMMNSIRSRRVYRSKIQEYKRIMMLIASNDIPRLSKFLSVSLRHGNSAAAIVNQINHALDGLYSPRGGFTQRDLDVAYLCQAIGGRRLLYALGKSHGLPSERTVRRNKTVPRLLPSVGVPTAEEIGKNISAFFDPTMKPLPASINGMLPGNTLGFDGVSIQKKCRYCPQRGVVLGLCREHSKNIDTLKVTDSSIVGRIWDALEADRTDSNRKVCWGVEATVAVVAPYSKNDHYSPMPVVLSPTDKSETSDHLGQWIQTVIDTWDTHPNGTKQSGPIWSIASDGDATFRRARHELCNCYQLDSQTALGRKLQPLLGLNLYTSKEVITATCDPKHLFKRFATLLRSTGMIIKDRSIGPNDIREQLIKYLNVAPNEVNDLLDAQDKQNVPKAVKLLRYLNTLPSVTPPADEFGRVRYNYVCFIAKLFSFFLEPFIDIRMNLDEQLESLSTFSHLAVALQLEHGATCLPGPLYADTQATIKNIYFVVARLQLISPDLTFYLLHEGTDRLERLFGDCRTMDHGRNFDILQLSEKMAMATLISLAFERNPDLDHGHRRLNLSSTAGVDHINPSSWLGNTCVGSVDLTAVWNKGRDTAVGLLESLFGIDKVKTTFNFESIFSRPDQDILRPSGTYIGVRSSKHEPQLAGVELAPSLTQKKPPLPNQTNLSSSDTSDSDSDDVEEELEVLEDDLPDNPNEKLKALQSFVFEGKEIWIDSAISSIHPNSWRQMSDRVYRVRGWNLDQFKNSSAGGLVDAEDGVDDDLIKVYDIVGFLMRVDDSVCLAVMEVKGFAQREGRKKVVNISAKYSDLSSTTSNSTVLGQIIKLIPSETHDGYWEWAREYVLPSGNLKTRGKTQLLTTEVPSYLIHPLAANMISYPSEPQSTRLRWALSAVELQRQMSYAWEILAPEFNNNLGHFESIPIIQNSESIPYRDKNGRKSFVVRNVSNQFLNRDIPLFPEKIVHCLLCGDTVQLKMMRGHVGRHILWNMRFQVEPPSNSNVVISMGIMPCGFCGIDKCKTKLEIDPNGASTITSDCIYHDTALDYEAASRGQANGTICSNVPIHCSLCPALPDGNPKTIWRYNALMHIAVDHEQLDLEDPNLRLYPDIPFSMKANMHISRAEETALDIEEERTLEARADFMLLNSDDFLTETHGRFVGKRVRADTQLTIRPPSKKPHL